MSPTKQKPNKSSKPSTKQLAKSADDDSRCQYVTADGRRCRNLRVPGRSRFCLPHAQQEQQYLDAENVAAEILGPLDSFRTHLAVNHALGKLFSLLAKNRIPVRNAAVLAYIAQLLLNSVNEMRPELRRVAGDYDHHYTRAALDRIVAARTAELASHEDDSGDEEEPDDAEETASVTEQA
jgi:hypothetical protein